MPNLSSQNINSVLVNANHFFQISFILLCSLYLQGFVLSEQMLNLFFQSFSNLKYFIKAVSVIIFLFL